MHYSNFNEKQKRHILKIHSNRIECTIYEKEQKKIECIKMKYCEPPTLLSSTNVEQERETSHILTMSTTINAPAQR